MTPDAYPLTLNGGEIEFTPGAGQTITDNAVISDATSGTVVLDGPGTLVLSATSTFTDGITLESGTLDLTATNSSVINFTGTSGEVEFTPGALDPALWFYAKWGCTFCQHAGAKLPISAVCAGCRFPLTSPAAATVV